MKVNPIAKTINYSFDDLVIVEDCLQGIEEKISREDANVHEDVQRAVCREIKHIRESLSIAATK